MPIDSQKQKSSSIKKIIFVLFFALILAFSPVGAKSSSAWLEPMAAAMKQGMEVIYNMIEGMTMGSLQQAAIKMIMRQKDRFIAGTSANGARFITNWKDYLVDNPRRNAQRYANDYISSALSGRGSANYRKAFNGVLGASTVAGEGFGKEAVLGTGDAFDLNIDYQKQMGDMLQTVTDPTALQIYAGNPTELFTLPDGLTSPTVAMIQDYEDYVDNGLPSVVAEKVTTEYQNKLKEEQTIAATQAASNNGYKSETSADGTTVVNPGINFQQLQANVENLPNLAIAGAKNVGELAAATVSSAISGMFNRAVAGVENTVNRQVDKVTDKAVQQVNKKVNSFGPGALYQK
ncbi:MAG: hypothetical protein NTY33_01465 [Candidatus Moranbacteria bacterium]|nr:hypothetical protein [Candidatus Moranbacteria bacterium]